CAFELRAQDLAQQLDRRLPADLVENAEAGQEGEDRGGGVLFLAGQALELRVRADEAGEQVGAPDAERMPGGDGTAGVEQGPELADEVAEVESLVGGPARSAGGAGALLRVELDGSRPLGGEVVLEALIPVGAADHAGRPGDALPP